uniref:Putative succinate dehydrogenase cytochrome b subunit n=1 Tax=Ixodes ricinus TaxID=34613 RepID=A0A0K8RL47_IXORI
MAYALRVANRMAASALLRPSVSLPGTCLAPMSAATGGQAPASAEFFQKNKKLQRPLSPHLTIYEPQITTMLSITHRVTGCGLGVCVYGLGLAPFLTAHQFPYYVEAIKAMSISPVLLVPFKFALAWALCYHTLNGMRHLAWDLGIGFQLKELYASGYTVLAISLVLGAILAFK